MGRRLDAWRRISDKALCLLQRMSTENLAAYLDDALRQRHGSTSGSAPPIRPARRAGSVESWNYADLVPRMWRSCLRAARWALCLALREGRERDALVFLHFERKVAHQVRADLVVVQDYHGDARTDLRYVPNARPLVLHWNRRRTGVRARCRRQFWVPRRGPQEQWQGYLGPRAVRRLLLLPGQALLSHICRRRTSLYSPRNA